MTEKFVCRIGCMDGREAEAVRTYVRARELGEFIDTIDDPGMVKRLIDGDDRAHEKLRERLPITVEKHGSAVVLVSGHAECAGNPVEDELHRAQVQEAAQIVRSEVKSSHYKVSVVALFARRNENGEWEAIELE